MKWFHRETHPGIGSDRTFGFVFAGFFLLVALFPLLSGEGPRIWALATASVFLVVSIVAQKLLWPLNAIWFRFGLLLHRVTNPIIMGAIFFVAIAPTALTMRAFGKTFLQLNRDPEVSTYWVVRSPPGPDPETMNLQF